MYEEWIPIVLFLCIAACLIVFLYLRHLGQVRKMDTVLKLAEHGGQVTDQMLQLLGENNKAVNDMRKGLILIAISLPVILGFIVQGNWTAAIFVGGILLCAGLAYLVVMKYGNSHQGGRQELD
ncbi:DUF6249 domain-containing protein [Pseudohongiella sp.]|uniref:DUF6249 domain-containing protein n=1 Tax=marine sediment metagenome TaxID=412755 RepID=A0A0F9VSH9_9ZZZZ|nr:DUF6249 domain-containing protein [Pseudohongiella sp.]HDZ10234.1 hypothetical protein [Pseudohongiella sp.]HEA64214.1 hypothetical protein [Pseudohongiella sp.]